MTVVVEPVPAIDPGLIVHTPVAGSPVKSTLPVGTAHEEGWLIGPTSGAVGAGDEMIVLMPKEELQFPTVTTRLL